MDRRGWPWKKKSSDKTVVDTNVAAVEGVGASLASSNSLGEQEKYKKVNYVQISMDSYTHLSGLENQVSTLEDQLKNFEDQVRDLNEKLSASHLEIDAKEDLVKQHAKVAEEAVSGWEKADAEALALKNQLESMTASKLAAENRASYLDGALKECVKQVRNVREESEHRLQETILTRTKQWDRIKLELESKIICLDQELIRSASENEALSRSLQEHTEMLMKLNDEKSQAEAEIEVLKGNIQSCEKEIHSLKFELQIVAKELDIRNEEKNMSLRSAEVANKQHFEDVKKIAKLEAECQRLRGLVRKRLPGPAAMAQMKQEVENLGREFCESRPKKASARNPNFHMSSSPEISIDTLLQYQKEADFLTTRLLEMEEESKILREALAARDNELLASKDLCAKTLDSVKNLQAEMQALKQQRGSAELGSPAHYMCKPSSLTSMSEDGIEGSGSSSGSWSKMSTAGNSHLIRHKCIENANHLDLMDDFLEMERLARSSNADGSSELVSPNAEVSTAERKLGMDELPLMKLRSRIPMIFEPQDKNTDSRKVMEDITLAMREIQDSLPQDCMSTFFNQRASSQEVGETGESKHSSAQDDRPDIDDSHLINQDLVAAISQISQFVSSLAREAVKVQDNSAVGGLFSKKLDDFSASVDKFSSNKISLDDIVLELSFLLAEASQLHFSVVGYKSHEGGTSLDCIDKVTLLENRVIRDNSPRHRFPDSSSDPDVPHEGSKSPGVGLDITSCKCSCAELEQLKLLKDNLATDLDNTKLQLQEMEQNIAELKSQLASSQKSYSLAETQLKCMAESYRSLETHALELEAEVNQLRVKTENLDNELREEKQNHQDALAKCKVLEEKLQRNESSYSTSLLSPPADSDVKLKQEREIAAAAEKLAECQESIYLLGRQLKALQPQKDITGIPQINKTLESSDRLMEEKPRTSTNSIGTRRSHEYDRADMHYMSSPDVEGLYVDSPLHIYNSASSPTHVDANTLLRSPGNSYQQNQKPPKYNSSSTSLVMVPEKHPRGFSRFFSSKNKSGH
ncbi:Filament-like plant protein [Dillenia turbinata]|uniref:Filament-like plant protein n=1 Tax=Dillenia turbinata TaxID=194707 RepID=A0AAN8V7E1_9MAGN